MSMKNINAIRSSLSRSVVTVALVFLCLIMLAWLAVFAKYHVNKEKLIKDQIHSTLLVYETNLSKQLSILASSPIFTEFLQSGSDTRNDLYIRFLQEVLTLKLNSVVGMRLVYKTSPLMKNIESTQKRVIFTYGNVKSPYRVTLKLCYLNNQLNPSDGICQHQWELFLSKEAMIQSLQHINRNIEVCKKGSCYPTRLISPKHFGSFPVVSSSNLIVPLGIKQETNFLLYMISAVTILLLVLLVLVIRHKTKKIVNESFATPLGRVISSLKRGEIPETQGYIEELEYLCSQILVYYKQKDKLEVARIAEQAAHDIRSPLLALKVAIRHLSNISEDERILIRNATDQIDAIVNNLLRHNVSKEAINYDQLKNVMLMPAIEYLIPQKEKELSEKNISLDMSYKVLNKEVYTSFIKVIPSELQRILSNLTNNAIEAMSDMENGKLRIQLDINKNEVVIEVTDTGSGIAEKDISKIFEKGVSLKDGGNGLGLYHAKENVENWHGNIKIFSEVDKGTRVRITLPRQKTATWFSKHISLVSYSKLVIVDDSKSISNIWEKRLKVDGGDTIDLIYFSDPFKFLSWYNESDDAVKTEMTFLIDYEFSGEKITGLDIIKQMHPSSQRFLVTSRAENFVLQDECQNAKIKLIPKYFAPIIPLFIINNSPDIIFIEKDKTLRTAWQFRAKKQGLTCFLYKGGDEFNSDVRLFNRDCMIYVGEEYTSSISLLNELGFAHVKITTYNTNKTKGNVESVFQFVSKNISAFK